MGLASFNRMRRELAEKNKPAEVENPQEDNKKIIKLIENVDKLKESNLKKLSEYFGIEFVSIEETLPLVKEAIANKDKE